MKKALPLAFVLPLLLCFSPALLANAVCAKNGAGYTIMYSGHYYDDNGTSHEFSSGRLYASQDYKQTIGSYPMAFVKVEYWNGSKWKLLYDGGQYASTTIKASGTLFNPKYETIDISCF